MKKGIIINEWRCNPLSFSCAMCQSEQVGCLSLCVCLPADFTSPIPSFKHTKYVLYPFLPAWPPLSLSLSLAFFILYYFPYLCLSTSVFLHTFIHQSFSPRQPQFSTVIFAHSTRRVKLFVQNNVFFPSVIPVMFHCQLTQTMQSFTAVDIGMFLVLRKNAYIDNV